MREIELKARDLLASCLNEWGHHQEAGNVRDGDDLESYEFELRVIGQLLLFGFDTGHGHATRAPQWQPIETAPKDGTFFLAVVKGFAPAVAQWTTDFRPEGEFTFLEPGMFADESHWDEMLAQTDPWQPTHWQPLPAAPEVSA